MSFKTPLADHPITVIPQPQRVILGSTITGDYQLVGSLFGAGVMLLILVSTMDADVQISLDGVNDFMPVLSEAAIPLDITSDRAVLSGALGVYVKTLGSPSTGSLYVSVLAA